MQIDHSEARRASPAAPRRAAPPAPAPALALHYLLDRDAPTATCLTASQNEKLLVTYVLLLVISKLSPFLPFFKIYLLKVFFSIGAGKRSLGAQKLVPKFLSHST